jgi:hypothetical protein
LSVAHDGQVLALTFVGVSTSTAASCGSGGLSDIVVPHDEQNLLVTGTAA